KMDTTCSAITAETMTSKTFAFRQVHGHIHGGMRDGSRLRFLGRLLHVPARLKTLETSALVRVFATWPPSLTRSGRAWCDFSCAVWCVPSLFDTSVDVTGERNIASLIAFGGADRRAQASGLELPKQGLRLLSQHVGFEPVVPVQSQGRGFDRHPTRLLVQPPGGPGQPPPRLLGLAQPPGSDCQPQPVQHRPARPTV